MESELSARFSYFTVCASIQFESTFACLNASKFCSTFSRAEIPISFLRSMGNDTNSLITLVRSSALFL